MCVCMCVCVCVCVCVKPSDLPIEAAFGLLLMVSVL
jgi:hypothetical protein